MAITQNTGTFSSAPRGLNNNLYRPTDPTKYTSLADFIDTVNAPDVRSKLSKTFGNQGISGFLKLTGAVKQNGTADNVQYYEEARLHQTQTAVVDTAVATGANPATITFDGMLEVQDGSFADASSRQKIVRNGDILLLNGVDRLIVLNEDSAGSAGGEFTACLLYTSDAADE